MVDGEGRDKVKITSEITPELREELAVTFAMALQTRRRELNLSQERVSQWMGATQGAISHLERGRSRPDVVDLVLLAQCLDVPVDKLLAPLYPLAAQLDPLPKRLDI